MGEDKGQVGTRVDDGQKSPDELRQEIEDTRRDLGDTAAALAQKTDVKSRAQEKVAAVKQTVSEKTAGSTATQAKTKARENPVMVAALAAFAGGLIVGRITSR
jgi:uncharacterized protein DUF3618